MMEKNSNSDKEDFKLYFKYVLEELDKVDSSGNKLVKDRLLEFKELTDIEIRKVCELVQFLQISEDSDIYLYYDWYRHIR